MKQSLRRDAQVEIYRARTALLFFALAFASFCLAAQVFQLGVS